MLGEYLHSGSLVAAVAHHELSGAFHHCHLFSVSNENAKIWSSIVIWYLVRSSQPITLDVRFSFFLEVNRFYLAWVPELSFLLARNAKLIAESSVFLKHLKHELK